MDCGDKAAAAGEAKAQELTAGYLKTLAENGMTVGAPSDQLKSDLQGFGDTMTDEWLEDRRRQGQGHHRRLQGQVTADRGAPAPQAGAPSPSWRSKPMEQPSRTRVAPGARRRLSMLRGAVAAVCLVAILVVIVLQMVARWSACHVSRRRPNMPAT